MKLIKALSSALALLVLGICIPSIKSDEKRCQSLEKLDYEYHGTKTIYSDARKYLKKADEDDLPKPFDDDSLEKEDKELREDDGCKPMAFYFIGRHSARFPDAEDIEQYNKDLYALIDVVKSKSKCPEKLQSFLTWRSKMQPKHDNLITELGGKEERDIARRFKKIYPEFFDTKKTDVTIGVTKKWRTAQTGAQFLQEVDGLSLLSCDNRTLPTNDLEHSSYNLDKVLQADCYKQMIEKFEKPFLEFHKQCEKIQGGEEKVKDARLDIIKDPNLVKRITDKVSAKLGLDAGAVNAKMLDSIYDMCRFENAMRNESVWCNLFDKKDIQALEYMEDVSSYVKGAYGPKANSRQSCPLIKDLVEAFLEAQKLGPNDKRRAYYYFSHAGPMKKLLAAFGMFRDEENFSLSRVQEFSRDLKAPKKRHFRTSIISPFSANLAFVLYRCQEKSNKPIKHKILATVTEQPVKLGGCKDTDCNSERFFAAYESMRSCDLRKICGNQV